MSEERWDAPDPRGVVDLHIHTTASDGSETPREIFEMAQAAGLAAIGFCDHDTIGATEEGLRLAEEFGIEFVPGCEIGISHEPEHGLVEVDLVAYYYDPTNADLQEVLSRLQKAKNEKLDAQLHILEREGFRIPKEEVLQQAQGETIRRPHIFAVLKRYYPEMTPDVFYPNTDFGGPWYAPKAFSLSLEDCVDVVERAGGVCVLSSPGAYNTKFKKDGTLIDPDVDRMVAYCAAHGVRGLEVVYSYDKNKPYYRGEGQTISRTQLDALIGHYLTLARELGMFATGGSDYHGRSKPQIRLGDVPVAYRYLEELKRAVGGA